MNAKVGCIFEYSTSEILYFKKKVDLCMCVCVCVYISRSNGKTNMP